MPNSVPAPVRTKVAKLRRNSVNAFRNHLQRARRIVKRFATEVPAHNAFSCSSLQLQRHTESSGLVPEMLAKEFENGGSVRFRMEFLSAVTGAWDHDQFRCDPRLGEGFVESCALR